MTADILGSNFNSIFTSMGKMFDSQAVGETTTEQSSSKPVSIVEKIKRFWNGMTGIEKVLVVFIALVVIVLIAGYVLGD